MGGTGWEERIDIPASFTLISAICLTATGFKLISSFSPALPAAVAEDSIAEVVDARVADASSLATTGISSLRADNILTLATDAIGLRYLVIVLVPATSCVRSPKY